MYNTEKNSCSYCTVSSFLLAVQAGAVEYLQWTAGPDSAVFGNSLRQPHEQVGSVSGNSFHWPFYFVRTTQLFPHPGL